MRTLITLILFQTVVSAGFAQQKSGRITGTVKESAGKPVEAVTVTLLKYSDSSLVKVALTQKSGSFAFERIATGKYTISCSHVGFENTFTPPFQLSASSLAIAIGEITLHTSGTALAQVQVTGKRPLIENRIDKTIVNVDASATNGGLNALEILEKSPGVTVDNDGKVSLKGKPGVVIMIDGKPTYLGTQDLANYLKNMPSGQLDQIEIMSQPPAKYDAAGNSGVINIITKRNKNNGFNGSLTTSAIVARYFKNTNNLTFNWRQGKVNFFANYGFVYWEGFGDIHMEKSLREARNLNFDRYSDQHTFGRYSDRGHSFRAGADMFLTPKTTVGFSVNGTVDKQSFGSSSVANFYDSLNQFVQYNQARSLNKTPQTHIGFNTNFLRKLDDKGSEISVDADYIFYDTRGSAFSYNYLFNSDKHPSEDPYLLNGLLPSRIDIFSIKGDYKKNLSTDITLEAGMKSSYVKTDNDAAYTLYDGNTDTWEPDTTISNHFIYKENINAAYVNWQQKMDKFNLQVGLRAEQTNTQGDQTIKNVNFKKNYLQFFPTAYLTYKRNENNTFGFSYGRRIERPEYESLNPFRFQLDRYTYDQGNPNLSPQISNNIEASYNYKGVWNISVNYTRTTDVISDVLITVKVQPDSNYTTYQTTDNVARQRNIGLSVNFSKQMTNAWMLNVFLNLYNNHYQGVVDSSAIDVSYTSFNTNFNTQYTFKKGWTAEISGFYYAKDYESSVILANGRGMFSIGGSKQVLQGKGSVKLNVRDPFYLMSFTSNADLDKGLTRAHYLWDNRRLILTLVYRFGKKNSNPAPRQATGASEEQNRVGGKSGQQ